MKKTLFLTLPALLMMSAGPALGAGNGKSGPTVGDCRSDGFYGNEPNIVGPFAPGGPAEQEPGTKAGRVVPSQSPGPKVTNPTAASATAPRSATSTSSSAPAPPPPSAAP